METQLLIMLGSVAANFVLAVLIVIHLRNSRLGKFLFLIIFGLTGWIISNYFSNLPLSHDASLWWNRLIFATTGAASLGIALFAESFPYEQFFNKKHKFFIGIFTIAIIGVSLTPFLVKNVVPTENVTEVSFGIGAAFYGIFVLGCLLFAVVKIFNKFLHEKKEEIRKILKLLIGGFGVFLVFALTTNLILPLVFGRFEFTVLAPFYTSVFSFIIFWSILRHKFLDIKVVTVELLTFSLWTILFIQLVVHGTLSERIINGSVLLLVVVFGIWIIKSVRTEIKRKEELQVMADKLAQANDQLRKLDQAKTEFISIASHQLRTPLTSVKGFISLVIEGSYGEINAGVRDALTKVYASSERLIQLVEDLLNVSRIESGRMQFTFEKGSIGEMMQELYDNFMLVAKNKDLYLDIKLPKKGLPEVTMDPSKIREVISNFTDNALKYTEKGGVTMKAEQTKDKTVKITISDTGIGVPADEMQYLFKKFSRGKDTGRLHAGGTGLGLYVGKNIVDAHHGKVWVESDGEGKGSRFIIELPIEQAAV